MHRVTRLCFGVMQLFASYLHQKYVFLHKVESSICDDIFYKLLLFQETVASLCASVKRIFPHSAAGKGAVLPATLTHRPRLLVLASEGQGQRTYLAPALLHMMEAMPCQKLDIPALFSNSARSPEEAITQVSTDSSSRFLRSRN